MVRLGHGGRNAAEAVAYAVGHRIRVEIRAILNEGERSQEELARLMHLPVGMLGHHIRQLLADGTIEVAYSKQARNALRHYYRAVQVPFFNDEEVAAMAPATKQATMGVILQAVMAEALSSFWAEKMLRDPRVWLSWRWFNVDARGRDDIADEQARSWERAQEIEAESAARSVKSGEPTKSVIVCSLGYLRSRPAKGAPEPPKSQ